MKTIILTGFIICLLSLTAACSVVTPSSPAPSTTPLPTSTSFTDFKPGELDVPAGQFLVIECTPSTTCSSECNCPVVEAPRSLYEFTGEGWLWVNPEAFGGEQALVKMMDGGLPGFYGYGEWREGIYPITALPYAAPPYKVMVIDSIRADGSVVISINGVFLLLAAGGTWSDSSETIRGSPVGCVIRHDTRLVNHGFLSREQISACQDRYNCK